jgi:hypothetical protein
VVVTLSDYLREAWGVLSSRGGGFATYTERWRLIVNRIPLAQVNGLRET